VTRPSDDMLRRYLLRQLPEPDADAVEAAYFADSDVTARLDDLDDDLVRDYLDDALPPPDRTAFEARLIQPAYAARLEFVRGMRALQPPAAAPAHTAWPSSWTAGLAAAAVVVLAVGGWWLATRGDATDSAPPQASTPAPAAPGGAPPAPPGAVAPPAATRPEVVVALSLPLSATRSGGAVPTVELPQDADAVVLRVGLPLPPLADLAAEVRGVDNGREWRGVATPPAPDAPSATTAEVRVPAAELPAGDYVLTLRRGDAPVTAAFFRVVRR
jgi:hypothetical protein